MTGAGPTADKARRPLGEEFDTRSRRIRPRRRSYVVCSTPRTGSGLLCRALISTGVAGVPMEYLNPVFRAPLTSRWGSDADLVSYARALRRHRTSSGGVFGVKLHWHHLEQMLLEVAGPCSSSDAVARYRSARASVERLFGRATFVHIRRSDLDRQAVSWWIAERTGVWSVSTGSDTSPDEIPYDVEAIASLRARIVAGNEHWASFFAANRIEPVEVVYEDLERCYEQTVRAVLQVAAGRAVADRVAPPATRKQADDRSEELLERFRAEGPRGGGADAGIA